MPLIWAHSEYIELICPVSEGRILDQIAPVAARYLDGKGRKDIEIWKPMRRVKQVARGQTLRIISLAPFRLYWSGNGWHSTEVTPARSSGLGIFFVDIPVSMQQQAPLRFTFFWTGSACFPFFYCEAGRWEGRDYEVSVV